MRKAHLLLLARSLPKTVLDKSWPKPPGSMVEVRIFICSMSSFSIEGAVIGGLYVRLSTDQDLS